MVLPSVIIGVKNWNDGIAAFWGRVDKGLKFCPDGKSGFVDVRDVVLFIERMIATDAPGEIHT
jgi:nucleoside-diphosphate-sugar epimerase